MRGSWVVLCALTWTFGHLPTAAGCDFLDLSCYACKYLEVGSGCSSSGSYSYNYTYTPEPEFVCLDHWPSETGNYDGPTFGRLRVRDNLANTTIRVNLDGDGRTTSISRVSDEHVLSGRIPHSPRGDEQCCRVTWECWYFWHSLDNQTITNNILAKSDCCIADFVRPKPECPNPPDLKTANVMNFNEPPACTRVEDS